MPNFEELSAAAPTIASFFGERVASTGLTFVATIRIDGWPRVSPMELSIYEGRLYVGSMPDAVKAQDLQRDPRCCVVTSLADKDDVAGEAKLFCVAREVVEADEWASVRALWLDKIGLDIGEPGASHIFELEIVSAAWQRVEGDTWRTSSWVDGGDVRERVRIGATGLSQDL
ncbi:MAG: pyridoxamine 5'-phosphate oxidase family protein [Acidimicrobiales bacterium]